MSRAVDCNDCYHLSITEREQNRLKSKERLLQLHICLKYHKIVHHRACIREHDPYLYPCDECIAEMNKTDGDGNG